VLSLPTRSLRIGRSADNDVVVADLSVSRHHAELRRTSRGTYEIVDLDSHNGTYLNGQRVTVAPVTETDLIGVGPAMPAWRHRPQRGWQVHATWRTHRDRPGHRRPGPV
jgi:pSer/pThr/pTyr-binding forkhead associated (FHA) protein